MNRLDAIDQRCREAEIPWLTAEDVVHLVAVARAAEAVMATLSSHRTLTIAEKALVAAMREEDTYTRMLGALAPLLAEAAS